MSWQIVSIEFLLLSIHIKFHQNSKNIFLVVGQFYRTRKNKLALNLHKDTNPLLGNFRSAFYVKMLKNSTQKLMISMC